MKSPNPEHIQDIKVIKPTDELKDFVSSLSKEIESERNDHRKWEADIDTLDKARFSIKEKKTKPWPGCANFSVSVIDNDINKLKPVYVNSIFGSQPIVSFLPYGGEDMDAARKREWLFDWRLRTQVKPFKELVYGIDSILGSQGMCVFRVTWKFSTNQYVETIDLEDMPQEVLQVLYDPRVTDDLIAKILEEEYDIDTEFDENVDEIEKAVKAFREGKTKIEMTLLEVEDDQPEIKGLDVKDNLIIPKDTQDLNDARFIDYFNIWKTTNELKEAMVSGDYNEFTEDEMLGWTEESTSIEKDSKIALVQLHEVCCWYDIDGDGVAERCIVTYPEKSPKDILKFIQLPYDHGMWPYVQIKRELIGRGFYDTRGYPSILLDYQKGISTALNQTIDNGTIMNSPERVARKGVISNPRNRRFIPGEFTEVNGSPQEYETRQGTNVAQPYLLQLSQYIKGWADDATGQKTSGLSSGTDLPGSRDRGQKTAKEVEALVAMSQSTLSLDIQTFLWQLVDVWYQVDSLYWQFGSEEEYVRITGEPKPQKITRSEIQGKFDIVPNGRIDNLTPQMRLQKAVIAMQFAQGNPYVKIKELTEDLFRELDPRFASRWVMTNEEIQQRSQAMAQQQAQQQQQAIQMGQGIKQADAQLEIQKDIVTDTAKTENEIKKEIILAPVTGKKYSKKD